MNLSKITTVYLGLALAGCATTPVAPKVVTVNQPIYVPIPPELSADCTIPALADRTVGSAIQFAIEAKGALIACNDRMAQIRALAGTVPAK
jgi:hypothetical protein